MTIPSQINHRKKWRFVELWAWKTKQLPTSTNWYELDIWPPWTCTSSRMAEWEVECERHRRLKVLEGWNTTSTSVQSQLNVNLQFFSVPVRNQAIYQTSADSFQSIHQPAQEAPEQPHPQRQDKTSIENCNCLKTAWPQDQTLSCSYQILMLVKVSTTEEMMASMFSTTASSAASTDRPVFWMLIRTRSHHFCSMISYVWSWCVLRICTKKRWSL